MRLVCTLLTGVALVVLLAIPVGAGHDEDRPEVRYRLTLYGKAPEGERFVLWVQDPSGIIKWNLCGDIPYSPGTPHCEGAGKVYTYTDTGFGLVGVMTFYSYRRTRVESPGWEEVVKAEEIFARSEDEFTEDATVSAYYVYDELGKPLGGGFGDGPGDGDRQTPEPTTAPTPAPGIASTATPDGIPGAAPDVGGGGDAGRSHMPAYTALALLAGSGYTAGRRRWTQRFSASRPRQE